MMPVIALLCYSGFTGLCLAMDRHYRDLTGRALQARVGLFLRVGGALLLAAALAVAVQADGDGWSMGLVHWCAGLMGSAMLLVFLLPYRPRLALGLAAAGLPLAPLLGLAL